MRMKTVSSRLATEENFVVLLVLLILLPRDFATSNDVIDTDSDECQRSTDTGDVARASASNGARCGNASGQPETSNAALKEQHETRIRDKETRRFILLGRFWNIRHQPPTDVVHVSSSHGGGGGDRRGFDTLLQIENNRRDRICPESTTYIYSSQCAGPRDFSGAWNDEASFRLYFKVEPSEAVHRLRETKVASAFLYMKKKSSLSTGSHRPALTNGRAGRQRAASGSDAGHGSSGRGSHQRRRLSRDADDIQSASLFSPSSPSSHRSETIGAATSNLKIVVNSFSRSNKKNRQEMRPVSVLPFPRQSSEWIRINLTALADEWMKRPQKNLGLQVTIRNDAASSSSDLNPDDYLEGINCLTAAGISWPMQLPQQPSLEEPVNQSIVNWTRIHLDNIIHPFLEVVTVEVPRLRSRHRRDVKTDSSSKRRTDGTEHDADLYKSLLVCKWLKLLKNSETSSSRTRHQTPPTSNPIQPMAPLHRGGQESN